MGDKVRLSGAKYTKYNIINNNMENFMGWARLLLGGLRPP